MASRSQEFTPPAIGLGVLDEEHSEIQRRYIELDRAILYGSDLSLIRLTSENLTKIILLHLTHEEEFLAKMSFPLLEEHLVAELEMMAEIFKIELDLSREELSASLRLRNLCREWLHEHLHTEIEELQFAVLAWGHGTGFIQA